ncbi:hypothetical protein EW146_g9282 [Bondarzewia mesenterica]|uniref:Uncharacterized protein n=1 Tax=Bondarzewia mesenterica TaxID=1095465 RepID=A0A4S4L804_9AGAM|nr:hypothetical protein EW146_g9282 [Bondarzewia mesenterica]
MMLNQMYRGSCVSTQRMPRKSGAFSITEYTVSLRITAKHVNNSARMRGGKVNAPSRAPLPSDRQMFSLNVPVPCSLHWFWSLNMNSFPCTCCTVSSSSSPVKTVRRQSLSKNLGKKRRRSTHPPVRSTQPSALPTHCPPLHLHPPSPFQPPYSLSFPALNFSPKRLLLFTSVPIHTALPAPTPTTPPKILPLPGFPALALFAAGTANACAPPAAYAENPALREGLLLRPSAPTGDFGLMLENGDTVPANASKPVRFAGVELDVRGFFSFVSLLLA